jgi:hypothetical protein
VYGVEEEVAVGGGGDDVAPVAVGKLWAVVFEADGLEEAFASVEFEGLLDELRGVEKTASGVERALKIDAEGDEIPGVGLSLAEVGIHADDGALLAGGAEASAYRRGGTDSGEVDEGVAGGGVVGGAAVRGVGDDDAEVGVGDGDRKKDEGEKCKDESGAAVGGERHHL